jgi:hypothetical protein
MMDSKGEREKYQEEDGATETLVTTPVADFRREVDNKARTETGAGAVKSNK